MAPASASGSLAFTRTPAGPSASRTPPTSVATMAAPQSIDSITVYGNASEMLDMATMSARR
jgi:hypothetical protein